jgi:hypothetical protein
MSGMSFQRRPLQRSDVNSCEGDCSWETVAHVDRLRKFNGDIPDIWKLAKPLNSVSAAEGDNNSHSITQAFECSAAESMASADNQRNNGPIMGIQSTVLSSNDTDVPIKEGTQPVFTGGFDTASQSSHPPAVRGDVNKPRLTSSAARVTGACDGSIGAGAGPVNTAFAAHSHRPQRTRRLPARFRRVCTDSLVGESLGSLQTYSAVCPSMNMDSEHSESARRSGPRIYRRKRERALVLC